MTYPPIETNSPPDLIVTQPGCQTNGSITVTTPALEYSFNDGATWTTNPTLSNLPPNSNYTYKVKIKTLLGCITWSTYVILHPYYLPEPDATQTNAGCGVGGTITITSLAEEYSINNGNTWSTTPNFTNLPSGSYNVMIKNEYGCVSLIKQIFIGFDNLQKPEVSYTQPDCGILGSITVLTNAFEYSFDNGITWSSNNVLSNLAPGFYQIKVKDNQNCISLAETVYLQPYVLNITINYNTINSSCSSNGSINITTNAQEYSIDDGNNWSSNPLFSNLSSGNYILKVRNGINCESNSELVILNDFTEITPSYQILNAGCETYGSITMTSQADSYSFDNGLTWSYNNTISNLSGNLTFDLKIKNNNNCISQSVTVSFNSTYLSNPLANNYHAKICDILNNGYENINLFDYNTFFITNSNNYSFHYFENLIDAENLNYSNKIQNYNDYEVFDNTSIFVAIISSDSCFSIVNFDITLLHNPVIESIPDSTILCEGTSITINAGNGFDSYNWSTGATTQSIVVSQAGNYSVTVTENHNGISCSSTKNFTVVNSNAATVSEIITSDWTDDNNTITVLLSDTSVGNYVYSLDGINYQNSNIFYGLESGEHIVFIKDTNGCGISSKEIYLLMYPKYFTPNGDTFNDNWKIKFSQKEPNLKITIFDRYGKLLKTMNSFEAWDGKLNGKDLPSDNYWFVVTRQNGKEFRGHFAMKR